MLASEGNGVYSILNFFFVTAVMKLIHRGDVLDSARHDNIGINQLTDCTDCTAAVGVLNYSSVYKCCPLTVEG